MDKIKKLWDRYREPFMYLFFGGLTTLINIVVFELCFTLCGMPSYIANVIAWILAVLFAYYTNRKYVFQSNSDHPIREMLQFYAARVFTLLLETIVLYVLIDVLSVSSLISKIISNIIVIVLNYVFSKLWIFKKDK